MSAKNIVMAAAGAGKTYVEDVFSTYTYNGNGSTLTINNGIDLSGKGGAVWIKGRSAVSNHARYDTNRGATLELVQTSGAEATRSTGLTAFNSNGFTLGAYTNSNTNGQSYVSWTFRKHPKFFDVVTYTGDGTSLRYIPHNLAGSPGFIIVKRRDAIAGWRTLANGQVFARGALDSNAALSGSVSGLGGHLDGADESLFAVAADPLDGSVSAVNAPGASYVAYLFANQAGGFGESGTEEAIISTGYFGTGTTAGADLYLGFEPQFLIIKAASSAGAWVIVDAVRGITTVGSDANLSLNSTNAENLTDYFEITQYGFKVVSTNSNVNALNVEYFCMAIRRPQKRPTAGTQVFMPTVYTGTNTDNTLINTTIAPDMVWARLRTSTALAGMVVGDRLRGQPYLRTGSTAAELNVADAFDAQLVSSTEYGNAFSAMNGFYAGNEINANLNPTSGASALIALAFKRARGFFDIVATRDTSFNTHNLGVAPELIIGKPRNLSTPAWGVYVYAGGVRHLGLSLNTSTIPTVATAQANAHTADAFSASVLTDANGNPLTSSNYPTANFVFYLFASLPGVSKVGRYVGTSSSQTIDCGFSTGARFVLLKRVDAAGDWYVFDTARGITSSLSPYILLNSTSAEVGSSTLIDPDNVGFVVAGSLDIGTYIYLAIA